MNSIDWQNDFQIASNWKITAGIQGDDEDFSDYDNVANSRDIRGSMDNIGGYIQSQWQPIADSMSSPPAAMTATPISTARSPGARGVAYVTPVTATVLHGSVSESYVTPTVDDLYSPGFFASASVTRISSPRRISAGKSARRSRCSTTSSRSPPPIFTTTSAI